jgi:hypothetical protein
MVWVAVVVRAEIYSDLRMLLQLIGLRGYLDLRVSHPRKSGRSL